MGSGWGGGGGLHAGVTNGVLRGVGAGLLWAGAPFRPACSLLPAAAFSTRCFSGPWIEHARTGF
eukprot:11581403-Alexandrium_andersonii.AAC.1